MKQLKGLLSFGLYLTAMLCSSNVAAQAGEVPKTYLTLNNKSIVVSNLAIKDSLSPDNKMIFSAAFDITVNTGDSSKRILGLLQSCIIKNKTLSLVLSKVTAEMNVLEERSYGNTSIVKMLLPALDARNSREIVKIRVSIRSERMLIVYDKAEKFTGGRTGRVTSPYTDNYRLNLGILPTSRVGKITAMTIQQDNTLPQIFNIEVSVTAAEAREWNQWFMTSAGGLKKEQGSIEFLAADLRTTVFTVSLEDVEIILYAVMTGNASSVNTTSVASLPNVGASPAAVSGNLLSKITIGLRTKAILLIK